MHFKNLKLLVLGVSLLVTSNCVSVSASSEVNCPHRNLVMEITDLPTCTLKGEKTFKCKECGEIVKTQKIAFLGHKFTHCACDRCGLMEETDEESKEVLLTQSLYKQLGLPESGDISIPSTVTLEGVDYTVVGLGDSVLSEHKDITSIVLPETIMYINDYAFNMCTSLKSINIPEGVVSIGTAAFQLCSSLENVELPDSIKTIKGFAFNHCSSMQNSIIKIPSSIEQLGTSKMAPAHMFYDCGSKDIFQSFELDENNKHYEVIDGILYCKDSKCLVAIPVGKHFENGIYTIPEGIENLGELSFSRNESITTVVIPDSLVVDSYLSTPERFNYNNYGNDLSRACYVYGNVTKYQVKDTNTRYTSENGVLYSKDMKHLVAVPNEYQGDLIIPEGVEVWDEEAVWSDVYSEAEYFKDTLLNNITSISIPSSMCKIPKSEVDSVNYLHETYGTKITVGEGNKYWCVNDSGSLCLI